MSIAAQEIGASAQYTDEDLIAKYFELKHYVDKRVDILDQQLKVPRAGMEQIKNALLARFHERGATNTKTEAGTAYVSKVLDVKVIDRQAFMQYCIAHWNSFGADMLKIGAVTEPVRAEMEKEKTPPGIETTTVIRMNIRKPA